MSACTREQHDELVADHQRLETETTHLNFWDVDGHVVELRHHPACAGTISVSPEQRAAHYRSVGSRLGDVLEAYLEATTGLRRDGRGGGEP